MNDFLGHVLTSAFATAPSVRPRLPSLFEPVLGWTAPLLAPVPTDKTEAAEAAPSAAPHDSAVPLDVPGHLASPAPSLRPAPQVSPPIVADEQTTAGGGLPHAVEGVARPANEASVPPPSPVPAVVHAQARASAPAGTEPAAESPHGPLRPATELGGHPKTNESAGVVPVGASSETLAPPPPPQRAEGRPSMEPQGRPLALVTEPASALPPPRLAAPAAVVEPKDDRISPTSAPLEAGAHRVVLPPRLPKAQAEATDSASAEGAADGRRESVGSDRQDGHLQARNQPRAAHASLATAPGTAVVETRDTNSPAPLPGPPVMSPAAPPPATTVPSTAPTASLVAASRRPQPVRPSQPAGTERGARLRLVQPLRRTDPVAPPPPTVQITIGRLEIRAVPAAADKPRKERPAARVLSLDEYLRQRAGGGAR